MMKTLRTLLLSSLVLALTSFGLPARDALARLSRRAVSAAHRRGNHRHCGHSRAWWRNYRRVLRERRERAALRRQRLEAARAAAAEARKSGLAPSFEATSAAAESPAPIVARASRVEPTFRRTKATAVATTAEAQGPRNPFDFALPQTWRLTGANAQGVMKFSVAGRDGRAAATATLAPFATPGPSAAQDVITPRTKMLGGIALPVLRRSIIDRMIAEGGWVTNDLEREVEGRRVYVVTAQKGAGGVARESWTFYFTEVEGRLYTLATNAPVEMSAPLAADSEHLLATLRAGRASSFAVEAKR
jgi:hypothetical protein